MKKILAGPFCTALAFAGTCALALSGCSSVTGKSTAQPEGKSAVIELPTDNQEVSGAKLVTAKDKNGNGTVDKPSWSITYAALPGHNSYNQAVKQLANREITGFESENFNHLELSSTFPVAAGKVIGQRLSTLVKVAKENRSRQTEADSDSAAEQLNGENTTQSSPEQSANGSQATSEASADNSAKSTKTKTRSVTVYSYANQDKIFNSQDLVSPQQQKQLTRLIAEALAKKKYLSLDKVRALTASQPATESPDYSSPSSAAKSLPALPQLLQDLTISTEGNLVAVLPAGLLSYDHQGQIAVAISTKETPALLSKLGKTVLKSQSDQESFSGLSSDEIKATPIEPPFANRVDCSKVKCVALSYDDGPGPQTHRLLDTLKEQGVKATFLTVGKQVAAYPNILKREVEEGHAVGCHTWDHPQLTKLPIDQVHTQIQNTLDIMAKAGGVQTNFTRPPYGAVNPNVKAELANLGQAVVMWDVDTLDWKHRDPQKVLEIAMKEVHPGSIILMHDIHNASIDIAPTLIKTLRDQGYTFVTIPQMYQGKLEPGKKYFNYKLVR